VEAIRIELSRAMQQLSGTYAQRFNRRHARHGHLFESRFSAWIVRDDAHFEATCRYVLDNPTRAGLDTDTPWPWAGLAV
jgi:hypothetical protein